MPGFVASIGLHSLLMTPILAGPQIIGLLAVADRPASLPFRDEDLGHAPAGGRPGQRSPSTTTGCTSS